MTTTEIEIVAGPSMGRIVLFTTRDDLTVPATVVQVAPHDPLRVEVAYTLPELTDREDWDRYIAGSVVRSQSSVFHAVASHSKAGVAGTWRWPERR